MSRASGRRRLGLGLPFPATGPPATPLLARRAGPTLRRAPPVAPAQGSADTDLGPESACGSTGGPAAPGPSASVTPWAVRRPQRCPHRSGGRVGRARGFSCRSSEPDEPSLGRPSGPALRLAAPPAWTHYLRGFSLFAPVSSREGVGRRSVSRYLVGPPRPAPAVGALRGRVTGGHPTPSARAPVGASVKPLRASSNGEPQANVLRAGGANEWVSFRRGSLRPRAQGDAPRAFFSPTPGKIRVGREAPASTQAVSRPHTGVLRAALRVDREPPRLPTRSGGTFSSTLRARRRTRVAVRPPGHCGCSCVRDAFGTVMEHQDAYCSLSSTWKSRARRPAKRKRAAPHLRVYVLGRLCLVTD